MTDKNRILTALRRGPITPVDFQLPNVIDGGKPILRVAARVLDLRADGHDIRSTKRGRVALYSLTREAGAPHASAGLPAALAALDVGPVGPAWADRANPYADDDGEEWAAA